MRRVPDFPGKPAAIGTNTAPAWAQLMCPDLTAADHMGKALARALKGTSALMALPSATPEAPLELEAIACQGPSCAFFLAEMDDQGKIIGGGCAKRVGPFVQAKLLQVSGVLAANLEKVIGASKS